MKQLTIFTPTYNRAYTLPRLYNSLLKQDASLFKWLIVDDGSTDNTEELVGKWIKEHKLDIKYIYQQNAGKMQAHNRGLKECDTELFLCCDSDDWMAENSIRPALEFWNKHQKEHSGMVGPRRQHQKELSGMVGPRRQHQKELSGMVGPKTIINRNIDTLSTLPKDDTVDTLSGLYEKGYKGETALIFRTSVIRKYPFPKIEGEKFITEDYIYCQLDDKYELLIYPQYCMECEYQQDGYTENIIKLERANPKGFALYYNEKAKHVRTFRRKIRCLREYVQFSRKSNYSILKILKDANYPIMTILSIPLTSVRRILKKLI